MTEKHRIGVMLILDTDDPRLSQLTLSNTQPDARDVSRARAAVLQRIPKDVERVVAILPIGEMQFLLNMREQLGIEAGAEPYVRPPPGYVKPTSE